MAGKEWKDGSHTLTQRGRLIRLYFENPDLAPADSTAILARATLPTPVGKGLDYYGSDEYAAGEHPKRQEVIDFKELVFRNFREYLDSMNFGFRSGISYEQIAILAGDDPKLTGIQASKFVASAGFTTNNEIESGIKKLQKKREMTETAITTPTDYIKRANEELVNLEKIAMKTYDESFKKYHKEYFFPEAEARKRANEDKEVYLNMLKKRYKELYSVDLEGEAKKHIIKTL